MKKILITVILLYGCINNSKNIKFTSKKDYNKNESSYYLNKKNKKINSNKTINKHSQAYNLSTSKFSWLTNMDFNYFRPSISLFKKTQNIIKTILFAYLVQTTNAISTSCDCLLGTTLINDTTLEYNFDSSCGHGLSEFRITWPLPCISCSQNNIIIDNYDYTCLSDPSCGTGICSGASSDQVIEIELDKYSSCSPISSVVVTIPGATATYGFVIEKLEEAENMTKYQIMLLMMKVMIILKLF